MLRRTGILSSLRPGSVLRTQVNASRLNSSVAGQKKENVSENFYDEDEWLRYIKAYRKQVESVGIPKLPQAQINELKAKPAFIPTEQQIQEAEAIKDHPIPVKRDPVITHLTNIILTDGKRAQAEKVMQKALYIVKLKTGMDPVAVVKDLLNKVAPLVALKTQKSRTAKSIVKPIALNQKQRYRKAWMWIVEGCAKRKNKDFGIRLGEEIVHAHEGKTNMMDRRSTIHKTVMLQRAFLKVK